MPASLIFHPPDQPHRRPSPFEESIGKVAASGRTLLLASPYMSLAVLNKVIGQASQFRLLTDAEQWMRTTNSSERERVVTFCERYSAQVRHARGLHAKIVATDRLAMCGSANLTSGGLDLLEEMSILIDDPEIVEHLGQWHAALWDRAAVIDPNELRAFGERVPEPSGTESIRLPGLRPVARSAAPRAPSAPQVGEESAVKRLTALRVSGAWLSVYLNSIGLLYEHLGLSENDPRLALTLTTDGNAPLSINNRWVLDCLRLADRSGENPPIRLAIPAELVGGRTENWRGGRFVGQYRPKSKQEAAPTMMFEFDDVNVLADGRIRDAWMDVCRTELARGNRSSNRKFHSLPLLRAALDSTYRRTLLERVVLVD